MCEATKLRQSVPSADGEYATRTLRCWSCRGGCKAEVDMAAMPKNIILRCIVGLKGVLILGRVAEVMLVC